jgi:hypothetical protein
MKGPNPVHAGEDDPVKRPGRRDGCLDRCGLGGGADLNEWQMNRFPTTLTDCFDELISLTGRPRNQ